MRKSKNSLSRRTRIELTLPGGRPMAFRLCTQDFGAKHQLDVSSNLSKKTPIALSKLFRKVPLFRQHRNEMHHKER